MCRTAGKSGEVYRRGWARVFGTCAAPQQSGTPDLRRESGVPSPSALDPLICLVPGVLCTSGSTVAGSAEHGTTWYGLSSFSNSFQIGADGRRAVRRLSSGAAFSSDGNAEIVDVHREKRRRGTRPSSRAG